MCVYLLEQANYPIEGDREGGGGGEGSAGKN